MNTEKLKELSQKIINGDVSESEKTEFLHLLNGLIEEYNKSIEVALVS